MEKPLHTTNYTDTFIEVAEDYKGSTAKIPAAQNEKKTVARLQYELLVAHPYEFTSDDILFWVFSERNQHLLSDGASSRESFFSKGQPCFRASPLTKSHGFGVHADAEGKIALYPMESDDYQSFLKRTDVRKLKAMRTFKTK
jgi:hypothetical protein